MAISGDLSTDWFRIWPARSGKPRTRLICFPHAGVGSSLFSGWPERLPDHVELLALQLPGRESRIKEEPLRDFGPLSDALHEVLPPFLGLPVVLFGYSFGGTIAFEIAREMTEFGVVPKCLIIAAIVAPQFERRLEPISDLPNEEFVAAVQANFGGIPPQVTEHPELLDMMLPALRADMHVIETYQCKEADPLSCPISVLGGSDDAAVSMSELAGWQQHTSGRFRHRLFPGGHFFIREQSDAILRLVSEELNFHAHEETE